MSKESLLKAAEAAGYAMATDEDPAPVTTAAAPPATPRDVLRKSLARQQEVAAAKPAATTASLWERASLTQLLPAWAAKS